MSWRGRLRQGRTWLVGILVASLAAALTQLFTGVFTDAKGRLLPPPKAAPLQVTVTEQTTGRWVLPHALTAKDRLPPSEEAQLRWIRDRGGVDAGTGSVKVTVQGATSKAAVLTGLDMKVVRRGRPINGTTVTMPIGGPLTPRHFSVDLDQPRPVPVPRPGEDVVGPAIPAIDFPYKVSEADPEVFEIVATTKTGYYEWTAELRWIADGQERTTRIADEGGRPFRVSASQPGPTYEVGGDGELHPR